MRVTIFTVILVLSSTNISSATFFGGKEKRGFFGFGYSSPAATPVIAVAHHHHHLTYSSPITKVAYAAAPLPYPEPVAKVAVAHHHPIPYDVHAIPFPPHLLPYAAPWARIVYHHPESLAKLAYTPVAGTKFSYTAQDPIITKYAYTAPSIKKFGFEFGPY